MHSFFLFFYIYYFCSKRSYIDDGVMYISNLDKSSEDISSDRYTLSNAMALTVKLGVLEAILECYIDDLEYITEVRGINLISACSLFR